MIVLVLCNNLQYFTTQPPPPPQSLNTGREFWQRSPPIGQFNQWGGGGVLSAFGWFNQCGGGGGADVSSRPIQSMRCPRSRQIQPVDGGCCPLSANSASGGAHVCKQGGVGGRHSVPKGGGPWPPLPPPLGTPMTFESL